MREREFETAQTVYLWRDASPSMRWRSAAILSSSAFTSFERFCVAGHDRGARAACRMALDHPDKVLKLATFDILPTHHVLTGATWQWALNSYHWFFMAQPYDIPEKLIEGKEDYYILQKLTKMGIGKGGFSKETLKEYLGELDNLLGGYPFGELPVCFRFDADLQCNWKVIVDSQQEGYHAKMLHRR